MDSTSASNALELSLSLKPTSYVSKSLNHLFSDLAHIDHIPQKLSVLNEYLEKHQEELSKVEEFKRELPQCVLLLMDAIQVLNDEISRLSDQLEADEDDQCMNMTSGHEQLEPRSAFRKYKGTSPPFNPRLRRNQATTSDRDPVILQQCELNTEANDLEPQPVWKHNRRSWTPELHTRFVEALSLLGGPEVATPKQIRRVMKVEGLTNDQVKSHLQKYRLHSRGGPAGGGANRDPWRPTAHLYYRDFWNASPPQSNSQQQQVQGGRNGGLRIGGGSSSGGGRGSRENGEIKKSKKIRFGDA